jgi:hypothetical protein
MDRRKFMAAAGALRKARPHAGLNLCLSTMAENLQDPAREICGVIRYFGQRGRGAV